MSSSKPNVFIHLHTYDLRLHDSPSLQIAHQPSSDITHFLPVYVFDERQIDVSRLPNTISAPGPNAATATHKQELPGNLNHAGPRKTRPSPRSRVGHFHRSSPHRLLFLLQSVYGLRDSYRRSGGDMLIGYGKPEILVPELVRTLSKDGSVAGIWAQNEVSLEERAMLDRLQKTLPSVELNINDSKTLIPHKHLPFNPRNDTPDIYTSFRKKAEGLGLNLGGGMLVEPAKTAVWEGSGKDVRVSIGKEGTKLKPFPTTGEMQFHEGGGGWVNGGDELDSVDAMYAKLVAPLLDSPPVGGWSEATKGTTPPPIHKNSAIPFPGGEEAALARLDDYVGHPGPNGWEGGAKAKTYKATRNGLMGEAFSTKFSALFSLGVLSPREAGWRVGELLELVGKDKDTRGNVYWIIFELLWRDFFQFTTLKYAARKSSSLFDPLGYSSQISLYPSSERPDPGEWHNPNWSDPNDPARRWCEGRTGVPFIDANMRELRETGWMSNRGRQNVASFLTKDLYVDWRIGAEFFEMHLVDYDTCSNWGNWQYQAGVGNDPRSSRQFNPIKQAGDYDPKNEYIRLWLPELKNVPDDVAQTPWLTDQQHGSYPARPVVETPSWRKHYHRNTGGGHGGGHGGSGRGGHDGGGGGGRGGGGGGGYRGGGRGGGGRGGGGRGGHRGPKGGMQDQ